MNGYAELQVTTNYTFLCGASRPRELVETAAALGLSAIAVTDHNSLAGVVKVHTAAKEVGLRVIVGSRLDLVDNQSLLCFPQDKAAYSRLVRLLTLGKKAGGKGRCYLRYADLQAFGEGQLIIALADRVDDQFKEQLRQLQRDFNGRCYLALTRLFRPQETKRLQDLDGLARTVGVPTVVTNNVLYHVPERRMLQDVLTCIREGITIDRLGYKRELSSDRYLKPPEEMYRLFPGYADAVVRSTEIANLCTFSLDELRYQYPDEYLFPGLSAQDALEKLTAEGSARRYPDGTSEKVASQIEHELRIIKHLNYAPYFLTVWRIVDFARSRGILCQGRGSAANSAVCFCLGITSIDPVFTDLLFERFVSAERNEPPDIDVDFEHQRREEVVQWVYETYGRERAALTATVVHYRSRRAVREVGKALGLPEDVTGALAGSVWGWGHEGIPEKHAREIGLDPDDYRLGLTLKLSEELLGFPRHLSQHPGGFVISRDRLDELVPIEPAAMENRSVVEWDKNDLDSLNMMKVDLLALGMLSCIRGSFDLLRDHKNLNFEIATIPAEDPAVYDMLCVADSVGVFQVESRAQMNMLPRLKPRTFYDLVIECAIVRPGPIQGDMVHPYLRRRQGKEKPSFPSEELRQVLAKTLGVPLFQEQAMKIAIVAAGFSPGEADQLRRAMATFKNVGTISKFRDRFVEGMVGRGYERTFAERCFKSIEGFGSYGFPESHSASFAILIYVSSWIKCHHPEIFLCAILNAQPMGFYSVPQLIRDAKNHDVEVLPININASHWDCTVEARGKRLAVRIGLRLIKGLRNEAAAIIISARYASFTSIEETLRRTGVDIGQLNLLADADAFACFGSDRHKASWTIKGLNPESLPLFAAADTKATEIKAEQIEPDALIEPPTEGAQVVQDYLTTSFSLRDHPLSFIRRQLCEGKWKPLEIVGYARNGEGVRIAGLILVRQRPGSAKGVTFITLEDETANANLVVWPDNFEKYRRIIMRAGLVGCVGRIQREGIVTHVIVNHLEDLTPLVQMIGDSGATNLSVPVARADEATKGYGQEVRVKADVSGAQDLSRMSIWKHPRTINVIADTTKTPSVTGRNLPLKTRDFH